MYENNFEKNQLTQLQRTEYHTNKKEQNLHKAGLRAGIYKNDARPSELIFATLTNQILL